MTTSGSLATTVALVGGSTAANVHTAEVAVNTNATNNATASTLAKRDGSGSCSFAQVNCPELYGNNSNMVIYTQSGSEGSLTLNP